MPSGSYAFLSRSLFFLFNFCNGGFLHPLSPTNLSIFVFSVKSNTGCSQEELSTAVNSGVLFILSLVHNYQVFIFSSSCRIGNPALFLSTFMPVSNYLFNDIAPCVWKCSTFWEFIFEISLWIKFQFVFSHLCLAALILVFCANYP